MYRLWNYLVRIFYSICARFLAWRYDSSKESAQVAQTRKQLVESVPQNAHLLELGAGAGANLSAGLYQGTPGRFQSLTLVEPDEGMRSILLSKVESNTTAVDPKNVSVVDAALPNLPFEDASFDAVVIFLVLSHIRRRKEGIKEIARILKPGGQLFFLDHPAHEHHHHHGDIGEGTSHDIELEETSSDNTNQNAQQSLNSSLRQRHTTSAQSHGEQQGEQHEHNHHHHHHETKSRTPFFFEWIRWSLMKREHLDDLSLQPLIDDILAEKTLEQVYETRIEVDDFHFKQISYGCFRRK